jgi:hypothetical protein
MDDAGLDSLIDDRSFHAALAQRDEQSQTDTKDGRRNEEMHVCEDGSSV